MKTKHLVLLLLILFSYNSKAQEFKLGKVSIAELEQKVHPKDSAAVAAILHKKGETRFEYSQGKGFVVFTEVAMRIKIYKKDGYNWANQAVGFISKNSSIDETVDFSDAATYNLVAGKIEKTKLKSEGEFLEKVNKYRSKRKITLPNVKEGSVLEFRYVIQSNNIGKLREFDFQTDIPVDAVEYKTYVPEYFIYNSKIKGFITPKITVEKVSNSFNIVSKERTGDSGAAISKTTVSNNKIDYQETRTSYVAKNMPAVKEEAYVNNIDNYTVSLVQELSMTQYPGEPMKPYSTDWEAVAKTIYEYEDFGPELNKTGYFEEGLKTVLAGKNTDDEKILAILAYVKSIVKWNEYNGYSCDNGVKKAYKEKTGNIADINLMLTAMLRSAGLIANPVLVSTRSNGIAIFPNRSAFNYVIAAVETSNGNVLLDASDKFSMPNVLPFRALNWFGRLIREDGSSEQVDLMPKKVSNDVVFMNYSIDPTGKISGKTKRQSTDYKALITRKKIDESKEEEYLEKLENKNSKIEISDYSKTNEQDVLLPIVENYSFVGNDLCEVIGGKIYIKPMLFFTEEKNPFKQEVREYPVDFGYPFLDRYNITIQIPEGFVVESLPAPATINMLDNLGSFKFNVAVKEDNTLQLSVAHQINQAIVNTDKYEMLKEYYKAMVAKETEKIILKKKV